VSPASSALMSFSASDSVTKCIRCKRQIGWRVEDPAINDLMSENDWNSVKVKCLQSAGLVKTCQANAIIDGVRVGLSLEKFMKANTYDQQVQQFVNTGRDAANLTASAGKLLGKNIKYAGQSAQVIGYAVSMAEILNAAQQGDTKRAWEDTVGTASALVTGSYCTWLAAASLTAPVTVVFLAAATGLAFWAGKSIAGYVCDQYGCATLCQECFKPFWDNPLPQPIHDYAHYGQKTEEWDRERQKRSDGWNWSKPAPQSKPAPRFCLLM